MTVSETARRLGAMPLMADVLAHGPEGAHDLVAGGRVALGPRTDEAKATGQHHGPVGRREVWAQA